MLLNVLTQILEEESKDFTFINESDLEHIKPEDLDKIVVTVKNLPALKTALKAKISSLEHLLDMIQNHMDLVPMSDQDVIECLLNTNFEELAELPWQSYNPEYNALKKLEKQTQLLLAKFVKFERNLSVSKEESSKTQFKSPEQSESKNPKFEIQKDPNFASENPIKKYQVGEEFELCRSAESGLVHLGIFFDLKVPEGTVAISSNTPPTFWLIKKGYNLIRTN